ncbi:MAG: type III secretion system cytoplasmic ring protein SctQ [Parachlamydiaceae bacterium]
MSSSSYGWLREINPHLKELDSIPLTGAPPPFPWDDFSARLARSFDRQDVKILPGEISWQSKEHLYEGMGHSPFPLVFTIPSIKGQICWIIPKEEIPILAALLLSKQCPLIPLYDEEFNQSFYRFLAIEALYHFTQLSFDRHLCPVLTNEISPPVEDSLTFDIALQIGDHTGKGRFIISPEFRQSWVDYFAPKQHPCILSEQIAELAEIVVHLEAGKTQLNLAEWMSLKLGDFLTLDHCSIDPVHFDGRLMLTINGKQTFRAKLKDETLKILELPLLHEVDTSMPKQPDDDFSDLDFTEEHDHSEIDDDDDDLFADTDDDLFDDNEEPESKTNVQIQETQKRTSGASSSPPPSRQLKENQPLFSAEEIPVTIVVEVGQVKMTIDQLLKLEPGNLLNVTLHPKNGVDLTINGKTVGKGELIQIGDVIGVRILDLGHQS